MADNLCGLTKLQLDALREISSIGAGNAATALSQFVDKKVEMKPPEIIIASVKEAPRLIAGEIPLVTMIVLEILGEVYGHILVIFEEKNALSLIDLLMGRKPDSATTTLSEIDISALKEVASVMSGSYLRVLGDMINKTLKMTPPYFNSVAPNKIPGFIIKHSPKEGGTTICLKSLFWTIGGNVKVSGYIVFIPSSSSLRILLRLLGMEEAGSNHN